MSIETMKQALEAWDTGLDKRPAMEALRTAIEQAEKQEPVAWEDVLGAIARGWAHPENARKPMDVQLAVAIAKEIQDMYTTPPAAQPAPVQVSPTDFVDMVMDKEDAIGKPLFWAEWPNRETNK